MKGGGKKRSEANAFWAFALQSCAQESSRFEWESCAYTRNAFIGMHGDVHKAPVVWWPLSDHDTYLASFCKLDTPFEKADAFCFGCVAVAVEKSKVLALEVSGWPGDCADLATSASSSFSCSLKRGAVAKRSYKRKLARAIHSTQGLKFSISFGFANSAYDNHHSSSVVTCGKATGKEQCRILKGL